MGLPPSCITSYRLKRNSLPLYRNLRTTQAEFAQFVTELAEICLEHYESGDCELNQIIKPYQIQRWCDPEDYLYNYIEDNSDSFIMAVIMDEDTVVVNTDCIFQGVYGYLITTQDVDVDQYFMVSPVLHFDGDSIRITSRINNELYYWAAGI